LLIDPKTTAVVLVSLPEELPVNETIELHAALVSKVKVHPALVVLNGFIAPRFLAADLLDGPSAGLVEVARHHAVRAELSASSFTRLQALRLPVVTVPRLFFPDFGRQAVEQIAQHLKVAAPDR
ncbi:MAG: ATPase, partial [Gammaproteobacteria bacterium]|nr:ATPase [Gammaproteobacteria bacterium]